jgi:putative ABC transport system ATP-binding protein
MMREGSIETPEQDLAPLVELRGVSRSFREGAAERLVLRHVDAAVRRGEFVALVGRSGSGKSTLLNLISGIDVPTAGAVLVDGRDVGRLPERERTRFRRHHVGFVFQFFNLVPTLTVAENLLLPLELVGRSGRGARALVATLLAEVGLADRADAAVDPLSGGEQQRVAVARALVHDPELILADEPTGNLDAETAAAVLGLLRRLARDRKATVIAATHSAELAAAADRVLVVRDGRVSGG